MTFNLSGGECLGLAPPGPALGGVAATAVALGGVDWGVVWDILGWSLVGVLLDI